MYGTVTINVLANENVRSKKSLYGLDRISLWVPRHGRGEILMAPGRRTNQNAFVVFFEKAEGAGGQIRKTEKGGYNARGHNYIHTILV